MAERDAIPTWVWIVLYLAIIAFLGTITQGKPTSGVPSEPGACIAAGRYVDC